MFHEMSLAWTENIMSIQTARRNIRKHLCIFESKHGSCLAGSGKRKSPVWKEIGLPVP